MIFSQVNLESLIPESVIGAILLIALGYFIKYIKYRDDENRESQIRFLKAMEERDNNLNNMALRNSEIHQQCLLCIKENSKVIGQNNELLTQVKEYLNES